MAGCALAARQNACKASKMRTPNRKPDGFTHSRRDIVSFRCRLPCCILLLVMAPSLSSTSSAADPSQVVYIGTYTGAKSKGIYSARFNPASGELSAPELAAETKNPSFLALHRNRRVLYAVGEVDNFQGKPSGVVSAYAIEPRAAKLSLLNQQPSGGAGPCHLDQIDRWVFVANY